MTKRTGNESPLGASPCSERILSTEEMQWTTAETDISERSSIKMPCVTNYFIIIK